MKARRFEVLSKKELDQIHHASLRVLREKGVKVEAQDLRDLFRERGADVDDSDPLEQWNNSRFRLFEGVWIH